MIGLYLDMQGRRTLKKKDSYRNQLIFDTEQSLLNYYLNISNMSIGLLSK